MFKGRKSLLWLFAPYVLFLVCLPVANRVEPVIFSMPFLAFWMLVCMLATPLTVWLAARKDPLWREMQGDGSHKEGASR